MKHYELERALKTLNLSLEKAIEFLKGKNIKLDENYYQKIDENTYLILKQEFEKQSKPHNILNAEEQLGIEIYLLNSEYKNKGSSQCNYLPNADNKVISLVIKGYKLNSISFLKSLDSIIYLDLENNEIHDISEIEYLINLRSLDLSDNNIKEISFLKKATKLTSLSLCHNKIVKLTGIAELTELNTLTLWNNEITDIALLKNLGCLKSLNLCQNKIFNLDGLKDLNLAHLDLSKNLIKDITSLHNLLRLGYLNLAENKIVDISCLGDLIDLISLNLSYNQIRITSSFKKLVNLTTLDLSHNQIDTIAFLKNSPNLKNLYLSHNDIRVASSFKNLESLTYLDLSHNQISDLAFLGNSHNLKLLDLSYNQISDLTPILKLKSLKQVSLRGNRKIEEYIAKEVLDAGWGAIKQFLNKSKESKAVEKVPFKNVKVLLLGNPNIGKSNLLEFIETNKTPLIKEITHGVVYKHLFINGIDFHFWDFGGQEYFHATHKLFFSPNALNVVLWGKNIPRDESEIENQFFDLNYWLRTVEQLNNKSESEEIVLIVENKIDLNNPPNKESNLNQDELQKKFKTLNLNYSNVSLLELRRVKMFKDIFLELSENIISKIPYPPFYEDFWKSIQERNEDFVLIDEINDRYQKEDVVSALKVFHNMGMLLYFSDIIPNKVFCKPQLLLELLYEQVLSKEKKDRLNKNEIAESIVGNLLHLNVDNVIALLVNFDLVFQIDEERDTFFIPQYLKKMNPIIVNLQKRIFSGCNIKIMGDNYLMSIAMLKIFSKYGNYVSKNENEFSFWRNGIIIEKDNNFLMIKFIREEQTIELYQDKENKNTQLQKEIVDFILDLPESDSLIKRNFENHVKINEQNKNTMLISKNDGSWNNALKNEENEHTKNYNNHYHWKSDYFSVLISNDYQHYTNWKDLNDNKEIGKIKVIDITGSSKIEDISNFNGYLNIEKNKMKKVFISYSHKDFKAMEELSFYLKGLERNVKIEKWTDVQLNSGVEVKKEIIKNLEEADIVIHLVSQYFIASDFIIDNELPLALKKKHQKNGEIILVLLSESTIFDLELEIEDTKGDMVKIKMGDFYFVPQDENNNLKPIEEWEFPAKAWKKVYEEIKKKI